MVLISPMNKKHQQGYVQYLIRCSQTTRAELVQTVCQLLKRRWKKTAVLFKGPTVIKINAYQRMERNQPPAGKQQQVQQQASYDHNTCWMPQVFLVVFTGCNFFTITWSIPKDNMLKAVGKTTSVQFSSPNISPLDALLKVCILPKIRRPPTG